MKPGLQRNLSVNMQQAVFIVSGIPGAGKTTVSRLLAERFDRGVHIESDLLQELIVTGGLWPDQEPADEARRQLRLRGRNVCMLANSFFEAGFTPVIDDVVIGSRLDEFRSQLRSRPLLFVLLLPRPEMVEQRMLIAPANRSSRSGDTWMRSRALRRRASVSGSIRRS